MKIKITSELGDFLLRNKALRNRTYDASMAHQPIFEPLTYFSKNPI